MREETGIAVEVGRLLYVCDYLPVGTHVAHVTFEATRIGGTVNITAGAGSRPIRGAHEELPSALPALAARAGVTA